VILASLARMRALPEVLTESSAGLAARSARIALVVVVALVATRLLHRAVNRFVAGVERRATPGHHARAAQRAATIGALMRSITSFVVWSLATLTIFGEVGVNLGPLIAGAGIIGVAVGFGAQNLVRDFLAGIFMLIEDQYGVGDTVDVGPATGVVEGVSLRTTRLRDIEGNVWHIPNGTIQWVSNQSQQWARALVDVDVDGDPEEAQAVIAGVAAALWQDEAWKPELLAEPEVWGVERLGPDGFTVRLAAKVRPGAQWKVARELRARMRVALDRSPVERAVPRQRLVNDAS
jgi:small conductance mechanosensitive channel